MDTTTIMSLSRQALELSMTLAVRYVPQFFLALVVLVVGLKLIKVVTSLVHKALAMERVDPSLRGFFDSSAGIILKLLLFLSVAAMIGVQTTSFIALLGAVGLAVGLSLQGSLSNLAGGILILFFKPYVVGDTIIAQLQQGTVVRIEMFTTLLRGEDGKTIIIPNGPLSNGVIVNLTRKL